MQATLTRYVLMVVIDPLCGHVVGLTKKKGPSHLLGKLTFPGGKIDGDESPRTAASREMAEETGVQVPESNWVEVTTRFGTSYELHILAAYSDQVLSARQLEEEPVWQLAVERHRTYAAKSPQDYAPDFLQTLEESEQALSRHVGLVL